MTRGKNLSLDQVFEIRAANTRILGNEVCFKLLKTILA